MTHRKKLIEVALPLEAINAASAREKSIRHGASFDLAPVVGAAAARGLPGGAVRAARRRSVVIARAAPASGVVLFRRSARRPERAAARLVAAIEQHGERLHELYLVATPERVRVRATSLRRKSSI